MIPSKLKKGDEIRIIAASESLPKKIKPKVKERGIKRLQELGLVVSLGENLEEREDFNTASPEQRLEDLHEAFKNPSVKAILAANGGSSANQLLKHIDYELVKNNPKIFCGLSDLTELSIALHQKTGLVSYYGPHFSMIAASKVIDYSLEYMNKIFFDNRPFDLEPSPFFTNTYWDEEVIVNSSFWTIQEWEAEATCIGGNLMTFNFLLGNQFLPQLEECILFIEENHIVDYRGVQKELQEILNHECSHKIKGLIIGRFQKKTGLTRELVTKMVKSKKELRGLPVVANTDISHSAPIVPLPYGGRIKMIVKPDDAIKISVIKH